LARGASDRAPHQAASNSPRTFDITDFGAIGDGAFDCTTPIAAAIEYCHGRGGGRVVVPPGSFLTGAIRLKSRIELHVSKDATLLFSTDPRKYPNVLTRWEGNDLFNYSSTPSTRATSPSRVRAPWTARPAPSRMSKG